MVKRAHSKALGFSLVELLVAVLFIGFLMAGMSNVFKSSVSVLSTSSEGLSSVRRNRMSIDLLYDDLNAAGMYLADLTSPPKLSSTNPPFYIIPNVAVTGATADDPATADQVFLYLDDPLPFEGSLSSSGGGAVGETKQKSASEKVVDGTAEEADNNAYTIDCKDPSFAKMVKKGLSVVLKDSWETLFIAADPVVSGKMVTIKVGGDPISSITGVGASGGPAKAKHMVNVDVMFFLPAQMVRYSVKMKSFDPQKTSGVPCLVRDQGTYSMGGFVADPTQESIVAENVSAFKAYLSADSGQNWAGIGKNYTGFDNGWTAGIRAELNTQLSTAGRADFQTTAGDDNWIRSIPTLVRLDVTTRTAVKRSEYSATPLTATAYKDFTQSLVIVPRHFGLTMN